MGCHVSTLTFGISKGKATWRLKENEMKESLGSGLRFLRVLCLGCDLADFRTFGFWAFTKSKLCYRFGKCEVGLKNANGG